ncbi:MAG: PHP domain-containing protein [Kofleriaceae bacterium]|nr:PHP domain-containing protein [Kofleriaceae bacterium]
MKRVALAALAGALGCGEPASTWWQAAHTTWAVTLTDGDGGPAIAGHVLLQQADGTPVHIGSIDLYEKRQTRNYCVFGPGVIGTWDGILLARGKGEVPIGRDPCAPTPAIRPGRYRVLAWRGLEHDTWRGEVDLGEGRGRVDTVIPLRRVWRPPGTLVADLHVHAVASNDSLVANTTRVIAQVAAGIEVIGLSDHNASGDLDAAIAALGLGDVVASIASNELTAVPAHLGVYPVPTAPGAAPAPARVVDASIEQLFAIAREFPGDPIIQVNHPRFRVTALYDTVGWDGVRWPPPFPTDFDAVEVLSGHTLVNQPDDRRIDDSLRDFYTFIDHGRLVTALGNSDTHHLNGVRDGLARNYVYVDDTRTAPLDEPGLVRAIKARRVMVSAGPLLEVVVRAGTDGQAAAAGPGQHVSAPTGQVVLDVVVHQADYVRADTLRVLVGTGAGPTVVHRRAVPVGRSTLSLPVAIGSADTWIGVDATGATPLPDAIAGSYQREKGRPGAMPAALINPILIDADGDGRWRRGEADLALSR